MGMDWTYWSRFPRSGLLNYDGEANHEIGPAVFSDSLRYPPLTQVGDCMYGRNFGYDNSYGNQFGNQFGNNQFGPGFGPQYGPSYGPSYGYNQGFPPRGGYYPPQRCQSDNVLEIIGDSVAAGWLSRGRGFC